MLSNLPIVSIVLFGTALVIVIWSAITYINQYGIFSGGRVPDITPTRQLIDRRLALPVLRSIWLMVAAILFIVGLAIASM